MYGRSVRTVVALSAVVLLSACGSTMESSENVDGNSEAQGQSFTVVVRPGGEPPTEVVKTAAAIVARRLDALGVAESTVRVVDGAIRVGTEQPLSDDAVDAIAAIGELTFRPVLAIYPGEDSDNPPADRTVVLTPAADVSSDGQVVLAEEHDGQELLRYVLGPTELTGEAIESAVARHDETTGEWNVEIAFRDGEQGIDGFNVLVSECYDASALCPSRQTAIVLDARVLSAPVPQARRFSGNTIVISGGGTTENSAKALAAALGFGALPIRVESVDRGGAAPERAKTTSTTGPSVVPSPAPSPDALDVSGLENAAKEYVEAVLHGSVAEVNERLSESCDLMTEAKLAQWRAAVESGSGRSLRDIVITSVETRKVTATDGEAFVHVNLPNDVEGNDNWLGYVISAEGWKVTACSQLPLGGHGDEGPPR
ncbi:MAG: hypothetical protein AB7V43_11460 [Acidimicrobiia bacterium]